MKIRFIECAVVLCFVHHLTDDLIPETHASFSYRS
jgi:hypothetical protein